MASKSTKSMLKRIIEGAAAVAVGSAIGVPAVLWLKNKLGV